MSLQLGGIKVVEVVKNCGAVPELKEPMPEVRTNETGAACNEIVARSSHWHLKQPNIPPWEAPGLATISTVPDPVRIAFFGTPSFAVPSLEALNRVGRRPVVVVTRPARPQGRGLPVVEPPIAIKARELGCEIAQPQRVRDLEFLNRLRTYKLDLGVVVAYGALLPPELLELPRWGMWNVHASLLPRWRGAAPVAAAIAAGDRVTGVTVQKMVEKLDAGPILGWREEAIREDDTAGSLEERLSSLGAELLVDVLLRFEREPFSGLVQEEGSVTWAPRLEGPWVVDWNLPAETLLRIARSRLPRPGVRVEIAGELVTVGGLRIQPTRLETPREQTPGRWVAQDERGACALLAGDGFAVWLERLKRPGRRELPAVEVLRGMRLAPGDILWAAGMRVQVG